MSQSGFIPRAVLGVATKGIQYGSEAIIRGKETIDRDSDAKRNRARDAAMNEAEQESKRLSMQADQDKYNALVGQSSLTYRRGRSANMLSSRSASRGLLGL